MKIFLAAAFLFGSYSMRAQAVFADPSFSQVFLTGITDTSLGLPPILSREALYKLNLPIRNLNTVNPVPFGSTKIKIGLGSKMVIDPAFDLVNTNTSAYFKWTTENVGGQMQLMGEQIAPLPQNFSDTGVFYVKGTILGSSTITANFLVTNHNSGAITLSDENGANNVSSQLYFITESLPVNFTGIWVRNEYCAVAVDFSTENEVNLSHFIIEYSTDAIHFTAAGRVTPTHNRLYHYTFNPPTNITTGVIYVRVQSVDIDGRKQYTDIKALRDLCRERSSIYLYPNPVSAQDYITLSKTGGLFNGDYTLTVFDAKGTQVEQLHKQLINISSFTYNVSRLAAGSYIINIEPVSETGQPVTLKFQKIQ